MSTNIKDVAKLAGVSISTVSRVFSEAGNVSTEAKKKVLTAAEHLHYQPNKIARSLAGGQTRTIGLILCADAKTMVLNGFFTKATIGISEYAKVCGYDVMFAFANDLNDEMNSIKHYINSKNVDGIILFANRENDECIAFLKKENFPFAVIGKPDSHFNCLWVDNDNVQASLKACEYLISKGHSKIAFVKGPKGYHVSNDRYLGFCDALLENGISEDKSLVTENREFTIEAGLAAAEELFSSPKGIKRKDYPTAIMACDDLQAIGVLNFLKREKIKNVSVMGFNNITLTQFTSPNLTSVDVNPEKLGRYAMKMIVDSIGTNNETIVNYIVETSIIERNSVEKVSGVRECIMKKASK